MTPAHAYSYVTFYSGWICICISVVCYGMCNIRVEPPARVVETR